VLCEIEVEIAFGYSAKHHTTDYIHRVDLNNTDLKHNNKLLKPPCILQFPHSQDRDRGWLALRIAWTDQLSSRSRDQRDEGTPAAQSTSRAHSCNKSEYPSLSTALNNHTKTTTQRPPSVFASDHYSPSIVLLLQLLSCCSSLIPDHSDRQTS
jgi:hypothetical protein